MQVSQFAPFVGDEEYAAIRDCFEANWLTEGPKSQEFLERLKELMGVRYACLAPNGTLALYLGLRALEIGPGDEVVVPDFTFMGSASAIEMTGATPVFCDIDPETLQADAKHFAAAITPKTRALMPVHIYGMTCDLDPILELANRKNALVIEDAAQAVSVHYKDRHAGTLGNVGCFSFFADKTITTGEGGVVVTNDAERYERLRYLRNQGRIDRGSFVHPEVGYNFRMTDLQAAVGIVQLSKLEEIVRRKETILERYRERLGGLSGIRFIKVTPGSSYVPFRVAVYVEAASELMAYLESQQIQSRTFFYPLHRQPAFDYLRNIPGELARLSDENFPGSNYAYEHGVCLPSFPSLTSEEIDYVCEKIKVFLRQR